MLTALAAAALSLCPAQIMQTHSCGGGPICVPPQTMNVWVAQCGIAMRGVATYSCYSTNPALNCFACEPACQTWAIGGKSCLSSLWLLRVEPGTVITVWGTGEPCPDRLNPQCRSYFNTYPPHMCAGCSPVVTDWTMNPHDVNVDGIVDFFDHQTLVNLIVGNDPRGDWNFDGQTNAADWPSYVHGSFVSRHCQ